MERTFISASSAHPPFSFSRNRRSRFASRQASSVPGNGEAPPFAAGAAGWTTGTFLTRTAKGPALSVLSLERLFRLASARHRPKMAGGFFFVTGFAPDELCAYSSLTDSFVPVRTLVRTPDSSGLHRLVYAEGRALDAFPGLSRLADGWLYSPLYALKSRFTGSLALRQPTPGPSGTDDSPLLAGRMAVLGFLLAALLPDGAAVPDTPLYAPMLEYMEWLIRTGTPFGIPGVRPERRDGRFVFGGKRCAGALAALFGGTDRKKRHVPAFVFRHGPADRRAFLTGLAEGCGEIREESGTLRLRPGSAEAAVQAMLLCESLGLDASLRLAEGEPATDLSPDGDFAAGFVRPDLDSFRGWRPLARSQASLVSVTPLPGTADSYEVITEGGSCDLNGTI